MFVFVGGDLYMLSDAVILLFYVISYAVSWNKISWMQFQNDQEILLIGQGKIREICFSFFVATLYWGLWETIKMIEIDYT